MDDPSDSKSLKATQVSETAQEQFSSFHVFGLHLSADIKHQHLKSFHARLMNLVNPNLLFVPELDSLFQVTDDILPTKLPVMQGGIDYAFQQRLLAESNQKLYSELFRLTKLKQQLGSQISVIQESGEVNFDRRRQNFRMMKQRRRSQYRNSQAQLHRQDQ